LGIAHQRTGDALLELGKHEDALREYQIFHDAAEEAARRDPEHGQWQRFLGNSQIGIGDALLGLGKPDEAIEHFRAAVSIYARLVAKDKSRANWLRTLAIAHQRAGKALAMKQDPEAFDEFDACLTIEVDEKAIDAQIRTPRLVHQECREAVNRRRSDAK
jgi:tetratricopeptide (TPR) repeat protein